jgi:hypothetical protein
VAAQVLGLTNHSQWALAGEARLCMAASEGARDVLQVPARSGFWLHASAAPTHESLHAAAAEQTQQV